MYCIGLVPFAGAKLRSDGGALPHPQEVSSSTERSRSDDAILVRTYGTYGQCIDDSPMQDGDFA
jgi:hypothetical protein